MKNINDIDTIIYNWLFDKHPGKTIRHKPLDFPAFIIEGGKRHDELEAYEVTYVRHREDFLKFISFMTSNPLPTAMLSLSRWNFVFIVGGDRELEEYSNILTRNQDKFMTKVNVIFGKIEPPLQTEKFILSKEITV